jgi:hypothetical protein
VKQSGAIDHPVFPGLPLPQKELILEKLKLRDPAAAKRCGDVEAGQGPEARRLRSFAHAVYH